MTSITPEISWRGGARSAPCTPSQPTEVRIVTCMVAGEGITNIQSISTQLIYKAFPPVVHEPGAPTARGCHMKPGSPGADFAKPFLDGTPFGFLASTWTDLVSFAPSCHKYLSQTNLSEAGSEAWQVVP
jgi:hypothetical protein